MLYQGMYRKPRAEEVSSITFAVATDGEAGKWIRHYAALRKCEVVALRRLGKSRFTATGKRRNGK